MRSIKEVVEAEFNKDRNQIVPNVVKNVFKFTLKVKLALEEEGYKVEFVGKTKGEKQYTPEGFTERVVKVDGQDFFITGVSHDALYINDWQYDVVSNGNDGAESIGNVAGPSDLRIPHEYWRKSNPPIKELKLVTEVKPSFKFKDRETFYREMQELNNFYEAFEGLQRRGGMVVNERADVEALASWGYNFLVEGWTIEQAKEAIRKSHEWRVKH